MMSDSKQEKQKDARVLFLESLYKPDHELRQIAHETKCFYELMEIRDEVIEYVKQRLNQ
jgi:hypothetical protein